MEAEQHALRKAILDIVTGTRPLPMNIVGPVDVSGDQLTPGPTIHPAQNQE
jgi:hypothetical protein